MRARVFVHLAAASAIVGLSFLAFDRSAGADGTILTQNATIEAGGNQGTLVTIDACAPEVPLPVFPSVGTIPAQGTFSAPLPDLPDTGDGSDGAFSTTTDMLGLAGGTYEHTSYTVGDGSTVSYTGPVTLLVQGDVTLEGRIESFASGESVTIIAGGSITVLATNGAPVTGISTSGPVSPVRLEAGERVEIGSTLSPIAADLDPEYQSEVSTDNGDVTIRAHGVSPSQASGVEISDTRVGSLTGGVTIGSAEGIVLSVSECDAASDSMLVQSFDGDLEVSRTSLSTRVGNARIESALGITSGGGNEIAVTGGDLAVHAFGGDVVVGGESRLYADDGLAIGVASAGDGQIDVSAAGDVRLEDLGYIEASGSGGIHVTAHDGDVTLEENGGIAASMILETKSGAIEVRASNDVFVGGFSAIEADEGAIEIRAMGDFRQEGETYVSSGSGFIDARAGDAISATTFLDDPDTSAPNPYFDGLGLLLVAGDGGIDLDVDFLSTTEREISLLADGDVRVSAINFVNSAADVTVQSLDGSIDVSGTRFETFPYSDSGAVLFESFGGSSAVIDARFAFIRTNPGFSSGPGAVSLLIHAGGSIDSFVLPKTAKLRIKETKPEKSSLRVAGFFDTGVDDIALAGPASVWIGETEIAVDLVPKGRNLTFKNDTLKFKIKPARSGSSRAKFSLLLKGNVAGLLDPNGELTLRFETQSADGEGTVVLQKGSYKLGKASGLLVAPSLFPFKLKATHKGVGKDSLAFQAGLATEGGAPTEIPDVTIRYGDVVVFTVPGGEFTKKGDNFLAKAPPSAPQIAKLNINFKREKIDLTAKGLDLGPLPSEAGPVTLSISIGDDTGTVAVRVAPVPKRGQAKY